MTCDEWAARLATLRAAWDNYLTGGQITEIQTGDKRVRYGAGNIKDLQNEIRIAQMAVDRCNGIRARRAIGIVPIER